MSDAPDSIWALPPGTWTSERPETSSAVEYIRADRVAEREAHFARLEYVRADRIAELESALREIANSAWSGVAERAIAREVLGK